MNKESVVIVSNNNVFPAGKYYVGDLCYLEKLKPFWDEICDKIYYKPIQTPVAKIWIGYTMHGDGSFPSSVNDNFDVDSGTLGVCQLTDEDHLSEDLEKYIFTLDKSFTPEYDCTTGTFKFGEIEINTDYLDEEDDTDDLDEAEEDPDSDDN